MIGVVLLSAFLFCAFAGDKTYGTAVVDKVISVYDGDTFNANLSNSYPKIIRDTIGIRIYGMDTPEMKDKRPEIKEMAVKAKELTSSLLYSGKIVRLKNMRRDKYFRINAEVWVGDICIADTLIKSGLAKPYFGDTKIEWGE